MVDALLIDVDGTLVDSNPLHVLAWLRAFRRLGHEIEGGRILELMGMGGDQLAATVLGDGTDDESLRAKELWKEEYSGKGLVEHAEPLPGAVDLLRELKRRKVRVALASSGEPADVDHYLSLLGGREVCEQLIASADVAHTKPAPDIFAVALERLDHPESVLVIGDTPYDIEAARRLGLGCIGVLTGGFPRAQLETSGAVAVYTGVQEVLEHLDEVLAIPQH